MDNQKPQIIEKLQGANNILVTVPASPSVDQLSAAIGLSLLLNKMNKHASAVFSGMVPRSLGFLRPEDTLEKDTDSLRDFIVALDKGKADKLRYKVEDEVVKIFITPYKTSITEKDLVFSQGDFNVDVVIALGVLRQADLDRAITAHGRILHDAVFITISNKPSSEQLGNISWQDLTASGLSELVSSLAVDMGKELIDDQIATALLTGIVAETDHFGNQKTTPQTMTVSATLLAAGANQQLIAKELTRGGMMQQPGQGQQKKRAEEPVAKADIAQAGPDGSLSIRHKPGEGKRRKNGKPRPAPQEDEGQAIEQILKSSGAVSDEVPQDVNTIITSADTDTDPFEKVGEEETGDDESSEDTYVENENTEVGDDSSENDQAENSSDGSDESDTSEGEEASDDAPAVEKPADEEHKEEHVKEAASAEAGLIKDAEPQVEAVKRHDEPERKAERVDEPKPEPMPAPPADVSAPEPHTTELPEPEPNLAINDMPDFEPSPSEPAPSAPKQAAAHDANGPVPELADAPQSGGGSATSPADVDEARKRVENALLDSPDGKPQSFNALNTDLDLGHNQAAGTGSIADLVPAPGAGPDLSIGLPTPTDTAPLNPLDSPVVTPTPAALPHNPAANEQAPLSNSPADQAMTMPVPGGVSADGDKASFGKTPSGLTMPSATHQPPAGPPPPPVPPPAVPPNFIPGP